MALCSSWGRFALALGFLVGTAKGAVISSSLSGGSSIWESWFLLSNNSPNLDPDHRVLEFGDYADPTFNCPATTTCPNVCVANNTDCPTFCDEGTTLCADGNCAETCEEGLESPCLCEALPIACPKVIDLYDTCFERFQEFYDADAMCLEEQDDSVNLVSFTGPWFVACYVYISVVTALVISWCMANQFLFPVEGSTTVLAAATDSEGWTQTGYKVHIIGSLIHGLVNLCFLGIQFLLFVLTIFYYIADGGITRWDAPIESDTQALMAFEIVWMVGFFWCFAFRYPSIYSVQSLFLRRCHLDKATHVAITAPTKAVNVKETTSTGMSIQRFINVVWWPIDNLFQRIFWIPHARKGTTTTFCKIEIDKNTAGRSFYHRMRRYVYDDESGTFVLGTMTVGSTLGDFLDQAQGLTSEEVVQRTARVGRNMIHMTKPTILGSIGKEFSKTFYLFQNFMVWTWFPFWNFHLALMQTIVRLTGGCTVAIFQYMSDSVLYSISHPVEGKVEVLRDGQFIDVAQTELVPGDVIVLTPGTAGCDMIVLKADHVLVDESSLTGEATPVAKSEIDPMMKNETYDSKKHKSSTVSAGTTVLEVGKKDKTLALITKTGSFTAKGELLSDVLSYERHKFKFDQEVKLVLFILLLEAIFMFSMVIYWLQDQWEYGWFYGMYVVGTVFPPLLPTVFVVSVGISAKRLQKQRITCTNPEAILAAGRVNVAFFDKTGTLTKQGFDFASSESAIDDGSNDDQIALGMAVCHTLTTTQDGNLVGNHVDLVAFESTGSTLALGDTICVVHNGKKYTVLKRYEFDNHRRTQSVIIQDDNGLKSVFVKGSPEAIVALCDKETVPTTVAARARKSAKSGLYQLAIASKSFDFDGSIADVRRDDVEKSLKFEGFLNFENTLRDETSAVLKELEQGDVISTMVTGDNVFTGIHIAREAGLIKSHKRVIVGKKGEESEEIEWTDADSDEMVDKPEIGDDEVHLALTGEAWAILLRNDPKYANSIARQVRVFGRCNPSDKVSVVTNFVENGSITLMCGDGENDCGALKAAHAGVAMSSSEASVVAPFTSLDKTITSVINVLREGRCALASAFACYKYMIMYGQIETINQVINAYLAITFTEWCWFFMDGIWVLTMAFTLPLAKAAARLSPSRPTASLLGPHTMTSACGVLGWNFFFLVVALLALWGQDWFQCRKWNSEDVSKVLYIGDNYETETIFLVSGYQYISSAMAFNFGYAYRQGWFRNYVFVFFAFLYTIFQFIITIYPSNFSCVWRVNCVNENVVRWVTSSEPVALNNSFNTTLMPVSFRWILVAIMAVNTFTIMAWEYFFVNGLLYKLLNKSKLSHMGSSADYEHGTVKKNDFV